MPTLTAEHTHHHAGFTCTAYLMAAFDGALTVHTITRGQVLYSKSRPQPTTAQRALDDLRMWAECAPLT